MAQQGGVGLVVYNRKEGRALGEVTKFLVYNARKRQVGGDRAATYFERTECVAGVQDMRFQELMPDVFHWLGIARIDRWASMSNMKHDALTAQGIAVVEQVPIPDELIPADARVEMDAKKAAGYYAPAAAEPPGGEVARGRALDDDERASMPVRAVRERSGRDVAHAGAGLASGGEVADGGRRARALRGDHGGGGARADAASRVASRAAARGGGVRGGHHPPALPRSRRPLPQPMAPFRSGGRRSLGGDRGSAARRSRRTRAHADRSRAHERAARCRRGPGVALCRRADRDDARALRRSWRGEPAPLRRRSVLVAVRRAVPRRCARAGEPRHGHAGARDSRSTADNPLVGLDGRAALLRRLGAVAAATPAVFGTPARLGHLYDYLVAHAQDGAVGAGFLLATLLRALGPVWPPRQVLDGVALGDCWRHPAARAGEPRRSHRRLRPVPQAHAVARVFAAGAARGGRARGDRPRRAHRAARVPQRRPSARPRRARAAGRRLPAADARRSATRPSSNGAR